MGNTGVPRRVFVAGSGVAMALAVSGGTWDHSGGEPHKKRFQYAPGEPAPWQPLTTVHGSVTETTNAGARVTSETGIEYKMDFAHKPFVWNGRVVSCEMAREELRAGDAVVLCGELETFNSSHFVDLQQVWINVPGLT